LVHESAVLSPAQICGTCTKACGIEDPWAKMRIVDELQAHLQLALRGILAKCRQLETRKMMAPTLTASPCLIYAGTCDKNIMYDCEDTLASHPPAISVFDLAIIQNSSFVQLDSSTMDGTGKWYFIGMEILPTRLSHHFVRQVTQYIRY